MMLTKNALGNLLSRYRAVLGKCRMLNVFGPLALAAALALGSAGAAAGELGGTTITVGETVELSGDNSVLAARRLPSTER
ncbi:MAG: hypothetical protein LBQ10_08915 [Desulfovibrio sp.]|jgi:hypothetical protein|nr:hypothetical protein [Desulfovibrio sp.]